METVLKLMSLIPKNGVSLMTGWAARLQLPGPLGRFSCKTFARYYGINMDEAEFPLQAYSTIEALFSRRLKPGARTVARLVASPADGTLSLSQPCREGEAIQAKGISYSVQELVFGEKTGPAIDWAWSATVYLAPHNYHRVHSPVSGELREIRYIPGELWPVNRPAVRFVRQLFVRNERLVFLIDIDGGGQVAVVMVGAFNVGRITSPFLPGFTTNSAARQWRQAVQDFSINARIDIGAELGAFLLGSTVVLVFDQMAADRFGFVQVSENRPILMGASLQ